MDWHHVERWESGHSTPQYIDANSVSYANGYEMLKPDRGDSPAQFVDNVNFWREHVPDLSMSVFDEIVTKHRHKKQGVAVRFVMSGTMPGGGPAARFAFEGAEFVRVVAGRATEWRLILDSRVVEAMLASIAGQRSEERSRERPCRVRQPVAVHAARSRVATGRD